MVTSGFHLWQFQVFNSGAEGLVVVFFWLDMWEIFFYPTPSFELGTSESLFLHSITTPWWLLVFTSDNFRYLTLVQRDWWWYSSDWTLWEIFFYPTPSFELGTSESLFLHSSTAPWWLLVFTSDNFRYLTLVQRDHWWYCSDWMCERFSFSHTWLWNGDHWISCPALYHCTMVTSGFHLWHFRYLTLVQREWCWYCSDWICERFSFIPHWLFNWGPLNLFSCTLSLHHDDFWFSPLTISGI